MPDSLAVVREHRRLVREVTRLPDVRWQLFIEDHASCPQVKILLRRGFDVCGKGLNKFRCVAAKSAKIGGPLDAATHLKTTVQISLPAPGQSALPLSPVVLVDPLIGAPASLMPNSMTTQSPGCTASAIRSKRPSRVNCVTSACVQLLRGTNVVTYRARRSASECRVVHQSSIAKGVLQILAPTLCTILSPQGRCRRVACKPHGRYLC